MPKVAQRDFQQIDPQTFAIERNSHGSDVKAVETRQRSAIGFLLYDDRISRLEQNTIDQIEGLERARGQQYVLAPAKQPRIALQFEC